MQIRISRLSSTDAMMRLLMDDVVRQQAQISEEGLDSSSARRAYVRALFALVEATIWALKRRVLNRAERQHSLLSHTERGLLREEAADVTESGAIRAQAKFLPLLPNVRFTFAIYARVFRCPKSPTYTTAGWQAFRQAQALRNRLAHPKIFGDLMVSDADVKAVDKAQEWFLESAHALLSASRRARKYDEV